MIFKIVFSILLLVFIVDSHKKRLKEEFPIKVNIGRPRQEKLSKQFSFVRAEAKKIANRAAVAAAEEADAAASASQLELANAKYQAIIAADHAAKESIEQAIENEIFFQWPVRKKLP